MLSLSMRPLSRGDSRFPGFLSNLCFFLQNPCFLRQYPLLPRILSAVPRVVCSGGGGGPCVDRRRLRPCTWFYPGVQFNLLFQSQFRVPDRLPFSKGTGEPRSANHPLVGAPNGDCNPYVYPPLYLQNGIFIFICHDSIQLREHD